MILLQIQPPSSSGPDSGTRLLSKLGFACKGTGSYLYFGPRIPFISFKSEGLS